MKIETVTLQNFRCFGASPVTVELSDITTLIGNNGCGKTAVLQALCRLFGVSISERRLESSDFHVPIGKSLNDFEEVRLALEVKIVFPELNSDTNSSSALPEFFHHMVIEEEGGDPFCRIRLEGTWTRGNLSEGYIEERIYWVMTTSGEVKDTDKSPLRPHERSSIHVLYVPAARDPSKHLKNVSGTLLARLLNAVLWSDDAKNTVKGVSEQLGQVFQDEAGVKLIHEKIDASWAALHDGAMYTQPRIQFFGARLDEVLKQVGMIFRPSQEGIDHDVERMSDGQKSLFYFAFVNSIFDIEQQVLVNSQEGNDSPLLLEGLRPPALSVFAVEEPENHLAPHFLGRVMQELRRLANSPAAQVLLTSHSPGILSRVDPENIRYIRVDPKTSESFIKPIRLPAGHEEAFKYVKNAVRAYPEIYFARYVVLCEGDSEEVVLSRLAHSFGIPIDPYFVSVVPLGGRHVNHFWRLLSDLDIPYITLLDLDLGKHGGGWGRIRYACNQLLRIGVQPSELLEVIENGKAVVMSQAQLDSMALWTQDDARLLEDWISKLEIHNVFFSSPLDLDCMMLEAFPSAYMQRDGEDTGPQLPSEAAALNARIQQALNVAFGEQGMPGDIYTAEMKRLMPWYTYLFLNKGKPSTHVLALSRLQDRELQECAPAVLQRLLARMKMCLQESKEK